MSAMQWAFIRNASSIGLTQIPVISPQVLKEQIVSMAQAGNRLLALFIKPTSERRGTLFCVMTSAEQSAIAVCAAEVYETYEAICPTYPAAQLFEREIAEQSGVIPLGHPFLKPVRSPLTYGDFYQIEGKEIHEVAVGPIHAGVIEPGHFRFQCHGETVFYLEIALGYQHRGIEQLILKWPSSRILPMMQTIAGDTTIGHTWAYCQLLESLSGTPISQRASYIRAIALELERLANHVGDLGGIANDVGFLPTAAFCGRLRGDFLNATALLCGNRFGRNLLKPGGTYFDLELSRTEKMLTNLKKPYQDTLDACNLLWNSASAMARLEGCGAIEADIAQELGMVGLTARACGLKRDIRTEFPMQPYTQLPIPLISKPFGDVYARARVRFKEISTSYEFITRAVEQMPEGPVEHDMATLTPSSLAVSLVEGFRGEICHVGMTDMAGNLSHYKIVDPSFHNWPALAMALRNQQICDFPLNNKSFNLSYCGHDL